MLVAREDLPDSLPSYLAARSNRRLFVNSSAFSARLRQSAACAFRNDSSIYATQNATDALTSHDMPGFSTPAPAPARKIVD
jgi:hypothetical protein